MRFDPPPPSCPFSKLAAFERIRNLSCVVPLRDIITDDDGNPCGFVFEDLPARDLLTEIQGPPPPLLNCYNLPRKQRRR
jgi:hypothetical protein